MTSATVSLSSTPRAQSRHFLRFRLIPEPDHRVVARQLTESLSSCITRSLPFDVHHAVRATWPCHVLIMTCGHRHCKACACPQIVLCRIIDGLACRARSRPLDFRRMRCGLAVGSQSGLEAGAAFAVADQLPDPSVPRRTGNLHPVIIRDTAARAARLLVRMTMRSSGTS